MEKLFIVNVNSFETKMVTEALKRNRKKFVTIEEGKISDQLSKKIEIAIKNKKQIIFVGFEPEKGEWLKYYSNISPRYRVITHRYDKYEKQISILKQIKNIIAEDILSDFEKVVERGIEGCGAFSMSLMASYLGYSDAQKQKIIKDAIKGKALHQGVSRKAWKDAEKAIENKKEVEQEHFIVVDYDYDNHEPILDLLYDQYNDLLVVNRKEDEGVLYTHDRDLIRVAQSLGGETWTTRSNGSSKYRVTVWGHLKEVEKEITRLLLQYCE